MAYVKYKYSNIKGEKGSDWNIEVWRDGWDGSSSEINLSGEGFEITWNGRGGTRNKDFIGSACTLNIFIKNSTDESFVYDVLTSGVNKYYIRIYKGAVDGSHTNLWWYGWLQPGFDVIENLPFPYVCKLTATDSYGYLNQLKPVSFDYEWEKQSTITDVSSETVLILNLGGSINVGGSSSNNLTPAPDNYYWHRTSADWWSSGDYIANENCLLHYYVSRGAYANRSEEDEEGNLTTSNNPLEYKLQDVFNGTLRLFNLVGFLAEGKYNFIQPNSLIGNTSGSLDCFNRKAFLGAQTSETINTLLTIDQSSNVILGGSSLTYEPSLSGVSIIFPQEASFNVPADTDLEGNTLTAGYVAANSGTYTLNYVTKNFTSVVKSNFSFDSNNHDIYNNTFQTTSNLTFKLSNGTNNYYLQPSGDGIFTWTLNNTTALPISIVRGYLVGAYPQPQNTLDYVSSGGISNDPEFTQATSTSNNLFTGGGGGGNFPCRRRPDQQAGSPIVTYSLFETLLKFECTVQAPPISGVITLTTSTSNNYYQRKLLPAHQFSNINDPTPYTNETKVLELQLTPFQSDTAISGNTEVTYTASQNTTQSLEYEELGSSAIGQTSINDLYAVKRKVGILYPPVTDGFRRGNSGDFRDILQLNVNEYLDLQTEPLEILQADIQSANISPLKLVKYSIDNDGSYKYYSFLGGTFKAQSEIMSGEWYKVESSTSIIIDDPTSSPTELTLNPIYNNLYNINSSISSLNNLNSTSLNPMVLGTLDTALTSGVAVTNISLDANVEGKYYSGQKLYLSLANGSAQQEITCSSTKAGVDYVDVSSATPLRDYPVGSIVLVKTSDLSNVITSASTPAGQDTQVQFNDNNDFGGTDLLTITNTDEITIGGPSGTNANVKFNSGADIVLGADTAGGTSSTIQYLDSGPGASNPTARVMLGAYATDVVVLSNRAANGEVQIRANTSTAGASGELTIATFKDTSVDFLNAAELRGSNIGNIFDTEAYLTAVDFCMTTNETYPGYTQTNGGSSEVGEASESMYATFQVPLGYKATHVKVNGSNSSSTFNVFACLVSDTSATQLTSNPSVNSNQALSSAQSGLAGKYLSIKFTPGATDRKVYGAKITLARV